MMKSRIYLIFAISALIVIIAEMPSFALMPMKSDDFLRLKSEGKYESMIQQWFDFIKSNPKHAYDSVELNERPGKIEAIRDIVRGTSYTAFGKSDFDANGDVDERDILELGFPVLRSAQADYAPSIGTQKSIVIMVDFPDRVGDPAHGSLYFGDLLFSENKLPTPSMRDFYHENSFDLLDCIGTVTDSGVNGGWFRINQNSSNYYSFDNAPYLVDKAIDLADPYVDFSQFDNNQNGWVESVIVIVSGAADWSTFWPHKWELYQPRQCDGVWLSEYFLATEDSNMGTFAHEHGHGMGLPDLYDYDGSSWGVGNWCLMSWGCYGEGDGVYPVHMSAWCRYQLGWIDLINVDKEMGHTPIIDSPDEDRFYRLWKNGTIGRQYFVIENRHREGSDQYIPGEGILIWHIDENGDQQQDNKRIVDLEEADGLRDIDYLTNKGDATDPFYLEQGKIRFSDYTNPNAKSNNNNKTGIIVSNITGIAEIMYATLLNNPKGVDGVAPAESGVESPRP